MSAASIKYILALVASSSGGRFWGVVSIGCFFFLIAYDAGPRVIRTLAAAWAGIRNDDSDSIRDSAGALVLWAAAKMFVLITIELLVAIVLPAFTSFFVLMYAMYGIGKLVIYVYKRYGQREKTD
jgi:hypothetical protein